MTNPMMFLLLIGLVLGQSSFTIKPKYPHLKLIEEWTFESMETITYAEEEESEVVFKDQGNTESLSFHRSGSLSFMALTNGMMKKGRGTWLVKDDILKIVADSETIHATYEINDDLLTITTINEETDEFFGYKTIVRYKK